MPNNRFQKLPQRAASPRRAATASVAATGITQADTIAAGRTRAKGLPSIHYTHTHFCAPHGAYTYCTWVRKLRFRSNACGGSQGDHLHPEFPSKFYILNHRPRFWFWLPAATTLCLFATNLAHSQKIIIPKLHTDIRSAFCAQRRTRQPHVCFPKKQPKKSTSAKKVTYIFCIFALTFFI